MSHTPTPWRVDRTNALGAYGIWTDYPTHPGHDGAGYESQICSMITASMPATSHKVKRNANAEFIVKACNLHEELVAALNGLLDRYTLLANSGDCGHWNVEEEPEVIAARAAIAKAENRAAP